MIVSFLAIIVGRSGPFCRCHAFYWSVCGVVLLIVCHTLCLFLCLYLSSCHGLCRLSLYFSLSLVSSVRYPPTALWRLLNARFTPIPSPFYLLFINPYAMLCYVVLCYVMLCYVMLCYVMLCYVMLCYVMLCYVMLCYGMLCYVMLCYVMLWYVMLCYVMLCYVMLCYVLCYAMCYVMLCYVMLSCLVFLSLFLFQWQHEQCHTDQDHSRPHLHHRFFCLVMCCVVLSCVVLFGLV